MDENIRNEAIEKLIKRELYTYIEESKKNAGVIMDEVIQQELAIYREEREKQIAIEVRQVTERIIKAYNAKSLSNKASGMASVARRVIVTYDVENDRIEEEKAIQDFKLLLNKYKDLSTKKEKADFIAKLDKAALSSEEETTAEQSSENKDKDIVQPNSLSQSQMDDNDGLTYVWDGSDVMVYFDPIPKNNAVEPRKSSYCAYHQSIIDKPQRKPNKKNNRNRRKNN